MELSKDNRFGKFKQVWKTLAESKLFITSIVLLLLFGNGIFEGGCQILVIEAKDDLVTLSNKLKISKINVSDSCKLPP